jgi:hypothetical protein
VQVAHSGFPGAQPEQDTTIRLRECAEEIATQLYRECPAIKDIPPGDGAYFVDAVYALLTQGVIEVGPELHA